MNKYTIKKLEWKKVEDEFHASGVASRQYIVSQNYEDAKTECQQHFENEISKYLEVVG